MLPHKIYLRDIDAFQRFAFDGATWKYSPSRMGRSRLRTVIGLVDDPKNQSQYPLSIDFTSGGHHIVIGMINSGKSTLLQTVVYSLIATYPPDVVNIYCMDFNNQMLKPFVSFPHTGAYFDTTDAIGETSKFEPGNFSRFFFKLDSILDDRKKSYEGENYPNFVRSHPECNDPVILVVIDNYGFFSAECEERYGNFMKRLAEEGGRYGIYLLISANEIGRNGGIPLQIMKFCRTHICLENEDRYKEYFNILGVVPEAIPEHSATGRGLILQNGRALLFQTALIADESAQWRERMIERAERMKQVFVDFEPLKITDIPSHFTMDDFQNMPDYVKSMHDLTLLPFGINMKSDKVCSLNLFEHHIFLVTGTLRSGKTTLLKNLMRSCRLRGDELITIEHSNDLSYSFPDVARYSYDTTMSDVFWRLRDELLERSSIKSQSLALKRTPLEQFQMAQDNKRIDIFVDDLCAFLQVLDHPSSADAKALFERFCDRGKGYNIFFFFEVPDRDQRKIAHMNLFDSIKNVCAGIHLGGRFEEQALFEFDNIDYSDRRVALRKGIAVSPSAIRNAPLLIIVLPDI